MVSQNNTQPKVLKMNEQKRNTERFMNPTVPSREMDATDLTAQIQSFISANKIAPTDWIFLNRLIQQLDKQKYRESRKVLRSMRNRFQMIQDKYQRS